MRKARFLALLPGLVLALLAAGSPPAKADFNVCNKTKERVAVALGYRAQGVWISQGWWNVEPARCSTLLPGKLSETKYYLYADAKAHNWFLAGGFRFCVKNDEFRVVGNSNCPAQGAKPLGFLEVSVGKNASFTYEIYSPQP
ncbi:MAG TPA: DUF1036 domain-containing protein [Hypericibacter adhaerens]|nr:DUF1036 domain-containing protein [Hypericibacter adhaerens]HWA43919.1 DUF1036 domain-containing protein [Hypericibacter adhaerens]